MSSVAYRRTHDGLKGLFAARSTSYETTKAQIPSRRLVTGKSPTWTMKRGCHGEVSGFKTIATCRDGSEKSSDESATSLFASF